MGDENWPAEHNLCANEAGVHAVVVAAVVVDDKLPPEGDASTGYDA